MDQRLRKCAERKIATPTKRNDLGVQRNFGTKALRRDSAIEEAQKAGGLYIAASNRMPPRLAKLLESNLCATFLQHTASYYNALSGLVG